MVPIRLIFCSTRADPDPKAVEVILGISQLNNVRDDLSGVLIVSEHHFVQLLEGARADVSRRFARILQDHRHRDVQIVSATEVPHRLFPEYPMQKIDSGSLKGADLGQFLTNGAFQPYAMSQSALEDLCRALAEQIGREVRSQEAEATADGMLSPLRQIHRAARHLLDGGLGSRIRCRDELVRLRAAIVQHIQDCNTLQLRLAESGRRADLQAELAELEAYLRGVLEEIALHLGNPKRPKPSSNGRPDV